MSHHAAGSGGPADPSDRDVSDRTAAEAFVVVGCSQKARTLPLNLFPIKYQNVFGLLFTGLAYSHRQGL
jgi:hypothetical protein